MTLWLVTNGWRGYGYEGVIVEAADEQTAFAAAAEAWLAHDRAEAANGSMPSWMAEQHAQRREQFEARRDFMASTITLPYVGEFA